MTKQTHQKSLFNLGYKRAWLYDKLCLFTYCHPFASWSFDIVEVLPSYRQTVNIFNCYKMVVFFRWDPSLLHIPHDGDIALRILVGKFGTSHTYHTWKSKLQNQSAVDEWKSLRKQICHFLQAWNNCKDKKKLLFPSTSPSALRVLVNKWARWCPWQLPPAPPSNLSEGRWSILMSAPLRNLISSTTISSDSINFSSFSSLSFQVHPKQLGW